MDKILTIADSLFNQIPENLVCMIASIDENFKEYGETFGYSHTNDLIMGVTYILMIETGFVPYFSVHPKANVSSSKKLPHVAPTQHNMGQAEESQKRNSVQNEQTNVVQKRGFAQAFNYELIQHHKHFPAEMRLLSSCSYYITFAIEPLLDYKFKLVGVPMTEDRIMLNLIVEHTIENCLTSESFFIAIQPTLFIPYPNGKPAMKFQISKLRNLSQMLRNELIVPARSLAMNRENIVNGSLLGIPEELKLKIMSYLSVRSFLNLGQTCKELLNLTKNRALWTYFLYRDYKSSLTTVYQLRLSTVIKKWVPVSTSIFKIVG